MATHLGLELRHLKTLHALRQTGSLIEASNQLHLTQSALSHQIKELEGRIGMELFIRKTRPVRFTSAGLRVLKLADEVLPQFRLAEQDLFRLAGGESGRLNIAIECHSCYQWLMPTIDHYRERWPEVEMDFSSGFNFAPLPALSRGELDLVVTSDPVDIAGVSYQPLFRYEMLLALSKRHPLTHLSFIEPVHLHDQTLIIYPIDQNRLDIFNHFLDLENVEPAGVRTVELTLMMLQLVASQRGVCALPNWALAEYLEKDQVTAKPLGEKGLWSTLYAAVREEQLEQPYIKDFLATAESTCFETLSGIQPYRKSR